MSLKVFGITGGICAGKSTVTNIIRSNGIPVVDADVIARSLVEPGKEAYIKVTTTFPNIILNDGSINRKKLGQLIFSDEDARKTLDGIMLPLVQGEARKQFKTLRESGASLAGFDCALIIESGEADNYRPLIVIHCQADLQVQRLMSRNHLTRAEAMDRISSQMTTAKKLEFADYEIDTSYSLEETTSKVLNIINKIK